jgi:hypothetical protein
VTTATLRIVRDGVTVAAAPPMPSTDLLDTPGGWLTRLGAAAGAPLTLDLYFSGTPRPQGRELDAFALCTVYGQVLWDDRAFSWHAESGRADSASRMREIHDLALRCYRTLGDGERLILSLEEETP